MESGRTASEGNAASVAAVWAEILGVEAVRDDDDFFGLGGDSIMVTIMTLRVEETLNVRVSPDLVFDHPTLEAFVGALVFTGEQV